MSTAGDKIRAQRFNIPQGLVRDIEDSSLRLFGFVLIDVAGAILEGLALAVESQEGKR